jgi:hypothetical protein
MGIEGRSLIPAGSRQGKANAELGTADSLRVRASGMVRADAVPPTRQRISRGNFEIVTAERQVWRSGARFVVYPTEPLASEDAAGG